ncbi:WD40 repeat domain-containing protein [Phreatobacter stygius]|uniref:WD40 repeat domain-containing protein n=1 Tax=Phreatobacter stygius TaxID=1940610 RepID=A0A4D7AY39_9HYPH|nr:WD40 repeat domain-containing protein [Phreatobacter stygius]QCI66444.1 WD40 repeat domain-containing protein [Phreatobacter stygius]
MSTAPARPSVRERVRPIEAGEPVLAAHFLGDTAVLALVSGEIVLAGETDRRVTLHDGGILDSAADGTTLISGGDDGKVVRFALKTGAATVHDSGGTWIDRVALGPNGGMAWSAGRKAYASQGKGEPKVLSLVSAAGGLTFFPKGFRLAVAHYGGVSFWYPNSEAKPVSLDWKGSHLGITISPDQRFVVTTMQEPQLHGWRIEDGQHMRMSGYPGKVKSFSWTSGAKFLATAGATEAILWPFSGKNGPMGVNPTMIAPSAKAGVRVTTVAGHPSAAVVAVGFADGLILLARIDDGAEILMREPDGDAVTAIAWRADGQAVAFGTEAGKAGLARL